MTKDSVNSDLNENLPLLNKTLKSPKTAIGSDSQNQTHNQLIPIPLVPTHFVMLNIQIQL